MAKVMVVAGEVSGDINAARIVREIKKISPDTSFLGMGSKHLREEGVKILIDPTDISTIGFMEAFKNIKQHLAHLKILKKHIKKERPDVLFLVDYSGFNMLMARAGRKMNIPVVSYFSPSAWIWGKWRARWMARNRAVIASVFPMETEVYREAGAAVDFVGHPLVDLVKVDADNQEIFEELELDPERPVIGLLPGSRNHEIDTLLPEMLAAAEELQHRKKGYQFILPLAPGVKREKVVDLAADYNLVLKVVKDATYQSMKIASLLITASGTVALEAALLGTPMVIIYKTSWSTYQLGKRLIRTNFIGLPNIIAGREIVPELIQRDACTEQIYQQMVRLLDNSYLLNNMRRALENIRNNLGKPGAVRRTAELVLKKGEK